MDKTPRTAIADESQSQEELCNFLTWLFLWSLIHQLPGYCDVVVGGCNCFCHLTVQPRHSLLVSQVMQRNWLGEVPSTVLRERSLRCHSRVACRASALLNSHVSNSDAGQCALEKPLAQTDVHLKSDSSINPLYLLQTVSRIMSINTIPKEKS